MWIYFNFLNPLKTLSAADFKNKCCQQLFTDQIPMENKHIFWYYWVLLTPSDFFPLSLNMFEDTVYPSFSPSPTDWLIDWLIRPFCNTKEKMYYAVRCLWYFSNLTFLLLRKVIIEICFWVCHFWIKVRKNVIEYKSK